MGLTKNETTMMITMAESQYHDGRHPVNDPQWFENPFGSKRTAAGVCSSLAKKGFAWFHDAGTEEHASCITQAGWDALKQAKPEFCAKYDN